MKPIQPEKISDRLEALDLAGVKAPLRQGRASSPKDSVGMQAIQRGEDKPQAPSLVNRAKVGGQAYFISDVTSLIEHTTQFAYPQMGGAGLPIAFSAMGAVAIPAGIANILDARDTYKTAKKVGYVWGKQEAMLKGVRGGAETLLGVNIVANSLFDALKYEGVIATSKTSFIAMRSLGHVATGANQVRYLAILLYIGKNLQGALKIRRKFQEIEKKFPKDEKKQVQECVKYLMSRLSLTHQELENIAKSTPDTDEVVTLTQEELSYITQKEIRFLGVKGIQGKRAQAILKQCALRKMGKAMELRDQTGPEVIELLKRQMHQSRAIDKRIEEGDTEALQEAQTIVQLAKKNAKSRVVINVAIILICIAAIGVGIAADILSAGVFKFILMGISLAITAGWLVIDGQMALDGLCSKEKGRYDEVLKWVVNIIALSVAGLAVFFTAGTPLLLIGVISAGVVLSVNFAIWYKNTYGTPLKDREIPSVHRELFNQVAVGRH